MIADGCLEAIRQGTEAACRRFKDDIINFHVEGKDAAVCRFIRVTRVGSGDFFGSAAGR